MKILLFLKKLPLLKRQLKQNKHDSGTMRNFWQKTEKKGALQRKSNTQSLEVKKLGPCKKQKRGKETKGLPKVKVEYIGKKLNPWSWPGGEDLKYCFHLISLKFEIFQVFFFW